MVEVVGDPDAEAHRDKERPYIDNDDAEGASGMSLVIFSPTKAGQATIVMTSSYERAEGRYRLAAYEAVTLEEEGSP